MTKKLRSLQIAHSCAQSTAKGVEWCTEIVIRGLRTPSDALYRYLLNPLRHRLDEQAQKEGYSWRWDSATGKLVLETKIRRTKP